MRVLDSMVSQVGEMDEPCGLRPSEVPQERRRLRATSTARPLSPSGCVWLLENACIEDRKLVLFGRGSAAKQLPKKLLACGSLGCDLKKEA